MSNAALQFLIARSNLIEYIIKDTLLALENLKKLEKNTLPKSNKAAIVK